MHQRIGAVDAATGHGFATRSLGWSAATTIHMRILRWPSNLSNLELMERNSRGDWELKGNVYYNCSKTKYIWLNFTPVYNYHNGLEWAKQQLINTSTWMRIQRPESQKLKTKSDQKCSGNLSKSSFEEEINEWLRERAALSEGTTARHSDNQGPLSPDVA